MNIYKHMEEERNRLVGELSVEDAFKIVDQLVDMYIEDKDLAFTTKKDLIIEITDDIPEGVDGCLYPRFFCDKSLIKVRQTKITTESQYRVLVHEIAHLICYALDKSYNDGERDFEELVFKLGGHSNFSGSVCSWGDYDDFPLGDIIDVYAECYESELDYNWEETIEALDISF